MGDVGGRSKSTGMTAQVDRLLQRTECPFTWNSPLPDVDKAQLDAGFVEGVGDGIEPMSWGLVVVKLRLATAFCKGKKKGAELTSRRYVVEAYMRVMPPLWDEWDDDLVQTYGLALRHLVDATWAHVCRDFHAGDPTAMRDLAATIENEMVAASDLCDHFMAALVALRGEFAAYPESISLARKAVKMNPDEGHWHCLLARVLMSARREVQQYGGRWLYSMQEEMTAASNALKLRKNVESYLALARVNEDLGYYSKAVELLREAMETYEDSAYLALAAADIVRALPKPHRDRRQALRWYEHALTLGDSPLVHMQLATLLTERGDTTAAQPHYEKAAVHMGASALRHFPDYMGFSGNKRDMARFHSLLGCLPAEMEELLAAGAGAFRR